MFAQCRCFKVQILIPCKHIAYVCDVNRITKKKAEKETDPGVACLFSRDVSRRGYFSVILCRCHDL